MSMNVRKADIMNNRGILKGTILLGKIILSNSFLKKKTENNLG